MRLSMKVACIWAVAASNLQAARDPRPADVIVCAEGSGEPPGEIEFGARYTVRWMYERIGVRLVWRPDAVSAATGDAVSIHLRYAGENFAYPIPDALAFALPFGQQGISISVMYQRILAFGGRSRVQALLAHVLAHEIGHILQGTDAHSQTGVMKAHWNSIDYDTMQKHPLEFTKGDVESIVMGLAVRRLRMAATHANGPLRSGPR